MPKASISVRISRAHFRFSTTKISAETVSAGDAALDYWRRCTVNYPTAVRRALSGPQSLRLEGCREASGGAPGRVA